MTGVDASHAMGMLSGLSQLALAIAIAAEGSPKRVTRPLFAFLACQFIFNFTDVGYALSSDERWAFFDFAAAAVMPQRTGWD